MLLKILKPHDKETVKQYIDKLQEGKKFKVEVTLRRSSKEKMKRYVETLPDGEFNLDIKQEREIRTISQNSLYWLWLTCIMAETGNDKDYLHIFFGKKYLPQDRRIVFNYPVDVTTSTTSLDTAQFTHYLERIQQFANSELGIVLPNPEDLHFKEFYETYKDFI